MMFPYTKQKAIPTSTNRSTILTQMTWLKQWKSYLTSFTRMHEALPSMSLVSWKLHSVIDLSYPKKRLIQVWNSKTWILCNGNQYTTSFVKKLPGTTLETVILPLLPAPCFVHTFLRIYHGPNRYNSGASIRFATL